MTEQFTRSLGLLGNDAFNKIEEATVCVIGLGGVGGTALEALARTGFKNFIIIDMDRVEPSNLNRQILYTTNDIRLDKVDAATKRLLSINNDVTIQNFKMKVDENNLSILDEFDITYLVDAIDDINGKTAIAKYCLNRSIPFIASLGMANRLDPTKVIITKLNKTYNDPLAKKIRYLFKKEGIDISGINVVLSLENPLPYSKQLNSIMSVPSSAGLAIAYHIIKIFID